MTQARRRIIVWSVIALLIVVGAILQARAAGESTARAVIPHAGGEQGEEAERTNEEAALLQGLSCAIATISFQFSLAEKACERAIALSPEDPVGYKYRGFTYLLEHRFERAEIDFRNAVRLDASDSDSQAGFGQALSGQGRFGEAIARFGIALNLSPKDARYLSARCWARAAEGRDFPAALRDCNLALRSKPHFGVAYDSRALVYLRMGSNAQAMRDYSTALNFEPHRASALFGRGLVKIRLGRITQGSMDIREARRIDPEIDDLYVLTGALEQGCLDNGNSCSLPNDLRPTSQPARSYLPVSYRKAGHGE